jgi:hypothetical protein
VSFVDPSTSAPTLAPTSNQTTPFSFLSKWRRSQSPKSRFRVDEVDLTREWGLGPASTLRKLLPDGDDRAESQVKLKANPTRPG